MLEHPAIFPLTAIQSIRDAIAVPSAELAQVAGIPARQVDGRYQKGAPGRPKGSRNRMSRQALDQVKSFAPEALAALHCAVQKGERWAVEFVLEKVLPSQRTIELDDATPAGLTAALADGDISANEAKDVATALHKLAEIGELQELNARLVELEQAMQGEER